MPGKSNHAQVVYKPLANSNAINETNLEIDGDEDELEVVTELEIDDDNDDHQRNSQYRMNTGWRYFQKQHGRHPIGLRQFRTILLAVASILLIIFILKLATYNDHSYQKTAVPIGTAQSDSVAIFNRTQNASIAEALHNDQNSQQIRNNSRVSVIKTVISDPSGSAANTKPKYDNYLSSIIYERDHKSDGATKYISELLDDFRYSINDERLTDMAKDSGNKWWSFGIRNGHQVTISNYIRAMKSFNYNSSVTLATQLVLRTQSFHHNLELCERWDGPISVSIFLSRGLNELPLAISLIKFVRQCLPAPLSACMRDKVTWHLVFSSLEPDIESLRGSLSYPKYHLDTINYSSFANTDQCPKLPGSSANQLIRQFQSDILAKNNKSLISLAKGGEISEAKTPLNVLRNIARSNAKTKFVLVTNVDLYPSVHLASSFIELVNNGDKLKAVDLHGRQPTELDRFIFPLPAFEMQQSNELDPSQQQIPKTKHDLVELISNGKAWPYREPSCVWCHEFSRKREWLNSVSNQSDKLTVFETSQWTHSGFRGWSPFFLAQNSYPDYNESLSINERVDLMYEMCLMNYNMLVLDNGFLIKLMDPNEGPIAAAASGGQLVEVALSSLTQKYKDSANIKKC